MGNFVSIILKSLNTGEEWKTIANVFEGPWDILHITGATDVKRIGMERPKKLGSLYYNYNVNNYVSRTIISINVSQSVMRNTVWRTLILINMEVEMKVVSWKVLEQE